MSFAEMAITATSMTVTCGTPYLVLQIVGSVTMVTIVTINALTELKPKHARTQSLKVFVRAQTTDMKQKQRACYARKHVVLLCADGQFKTRQRQGIAFFR